MNFYFQDADEDCVQKSHVVLTPGAGKAFVVVGKVTLAMQTSAAVRVTCIDDTHLIYNVNK